MKILLAADILVELGDTFGKMSLLPMSCFCIGIILVLAQMIQRNGKFLYYMGAGFIVVGLTIRMAQGGTWLMFFVLLLLIATIISLFFVMGVVLHKRAWLIKGETLSVNEVLLGQGYSFLLEREGQTTTALTPQGHMTINDITFYVCAIDQNNIEKGSFVKVVKVDKEKIYVALI